MFTICMISREDVLHGKAFMPSWRMVSTSGAPCRRRSSTPSRLRRPGGPRDSKAPANIQCCEPPRTASPRHVHASLG
eukprot:1623282-Prymnesium_polylepis.1